MLLKYARFGALGGVMAGMAFAELAAWTGGLSHAVDRMPSFTAVVLSLLYSAGIYGLLGASAGVLLTSVVLGAGRALRLRLDDPAALSFAVALPTSASVGFYIIYHRMTSVSTLLSLTDPVRIRQGMIGAALTLVLGAGIFLLGRMLLRAARVDRLGSGRTVSWVLLATLLLTLGSRAGLWITFHPGSPPSAGGDGRVLVIGIDGGSWSIIRELIEAGRAPNLASLRERGLAGTMTVYGPVHHADWTSMVTGVLPERHGVTRSFYPQEGGYGFEYALSSLRRSPAVWNRTSEAEISTGVVNWLVTTPGEEILGFMVGEKRVPGVHQTFPPELQAELAEVAPLAMEHIAACPHKDFHDRAPGFQEELFHLVETLRRQTLYLYERYEPQIFMTSVMSTDIAAHFFWKYHEPGRFAAAWDIADEDLQRYATLLPELYEKVDEWIGELMRLAGPEARVILLSDHGMRARRSPSVSLKVNVLLQKLGFLSFHDTVDEQALAEFNRFLDYVDIDPFTAESEQSEILSTVPDQYLFAWVDVADSQAFSTGTRNYEKVSGLRVNLRGREPQGQVEPGPAFEALRVEMQRKLAALQVEGEGVPLFNSVNLGENEPDSRASQVLYDITLHLGKPARERSADRMLVVDDLRFPLADVLEEEENSAEHLMEGIILAAGPGIRHGTVTFPAMRSPLSELSRRFLMRSSSRRALAVPLQALGLIDGIEAVDVGPTLLQAFGLPPEPGADGEVIPGFFTDPAP